MGGSSKKVTVGYKYYLGVHMVLCHGPIDKIVKITVDNKTLWSGNHTEGVLSVNKKNLFGGEEREGGISGNISFNPGGPTQSQDSYLVSRLGNLVPYYRGMASIVLRKCYIGLNPYLKRWGFWAERIHLRQNGIPQWYDEKAAIGNDMNPAHIIRECITDPNWGMGYTDSDVDDDVFSAAADTLYDEGSGMSLLWDRSMEIQEFIEIILKHIDGSLYISRSTGKFVLKLSRDDYVENDLLVLDDSNIQKVTNFKRPTSGELINSVTVVFWNGDTGSNDSITVQDTALAIQQGSTIGTVKQFPGFTNGTIASKAASRTLRALSTPLATGTIYANREASGLNVGDPFKMTYPRYGVDTVMRVTNVELGTLGSGLVKVSFVEDVFALGGSIYSAPPATEWVSPVNPPTPALYTLLEESPYWEVVQRLGETEAEAKDLTDAYIITTGVRPTEDAINAKIYTNPYATGYEESGTVDFCGTATLNGDVSIKQTVIPISNAESIEGVELGTYCIINGEYCEVEALSETEMTVARGILDTVPLLHSDGDRVYFCDQFVETDGKEYATSETARIRLCTVTGEGTLDVSLATQVNKVLTGRLSRPYPPGALNLNGTYLPDSIPGDQDLPVAWYHRDRLLQTATFIPNSQESSIGPEAGTTYTIELRSEFLTLLSSQSGIVGTTHLFTLANMSTYYGRMRIRLWSVRDGLSSHTMYDYEFIRAGYGAGYGYSYGGA